MKFWVYSDSSMTDVVYQCEQDEDRAEITDEEWVKFKAIEEQYVVWMIKLSNLQLAHDAAKNAESMREYLAKPVRTRQRGSKALSA